MPLLLKSVHVVDPVASRNGRFDILIDNGRIARVGRDLDAGQARVVELGPSLVVTPGLVDMHVHLREPGQEHKETIATGTLSAVTGGFTAVACMPNTDPINDNAAVTEFIVKRAAEASLARVYPIGAVSVGSKGEQLTEIGDLRRAGCVAITDDGRPVVTALLMRRALEYASMFDIPVIDHCEDPSLKGDGVAHEGAVASLLGLRGIPGTAESVMVERDISMAELTKGRFHVAHMSAKESLRAVRDGKARGVAVTCEVAPHHFTLTDQALTERGGYDTNTKMNPPLREEADRLAMVEGLRDGSIDVIATDHAPHHADEKALEFDRAPFGIVGLETCVSICFDRLVHPGVITLSRLVELLSVNPARILRVAGGTLAEGAPADISVLAPDARVTVKASALRSKSKNTPFDGWTLQGGVAATIVGGRVVYVNEAVNGAAGLSPFAKAPGDKQTGR
jgi:dihydroorotase